GVVDACADVEHRGPQTVDGRQWLVSAVDPGCAADGASLRGQNGPEHIWRNRGRNAAESLIFKERHELRSLPNAFLQPIELDEIADAKHLGCRPHQRAN